MYDDFDALLEEAFNAGYSEAAGIKTAIHSIKERILHKDRYKPVTTTKEVSRDEIPEDVFGELERKSSNESFDLLDEMDFYDESSHNVQKQYEKLPKIRRFNQTDNDVIYFPKHPKWKELTNQEEFGYNKGKQDFTLRVNGRLVKKTGYRIQDPNSSNDPIMKKDLNRIQQSPVVGRIKVGGRDDSIDPRSYNLQQKAKQNAARYAARMANKK